MIRANGAWRGALLLFMLSMAALQVGPAAGYKVVTPPTTTLISELERIIPPLLERFRQARY